MQAKGAAKRAGQIPATGFPLTFKINQKMEIPYEDFVKKLKNGERVAKIFRVMNAVYDAHWVELRSGEAVFINSHEGRKWVISDFFNRNIISADEVEESFKLNSFSTHNEHSLKKVAIKHDDIKGYTHCILFFEQCFQVLANRGKQKFKELEIEE